MVDYAGFDLPVWFEGIIPECKSVRNNVGLFDVSHMGRVFVEGANAETFLNRLTTNDVSTLRIGQGHYSLLCNPDGGIIDDLTVFRVAKTKYLMIYNAANREKNWNWIERNRQSNTTVSDVSDESAMFAVQGPKAARLLKSVSGTMLEDIDKYASREIRIRDLSCFLTRSGYTGEDGFEIYVWKTSAQRPETAMRIWDMILSEGKQYAVRPAGLGARDVLRLEAGMCLYGNDIDEETTPVEARLSFAVRLDKKTGFIGSDAIQREKEEGPRRVRVGFKIRSKGIPRQGQDVLLEEQKVGRVTSGTFSPTLGFGIGMGYVGPGLSKPPQLFDVKIRDRNVSAEAVKMPFYQRRSEDKVVVLGQEMGLRDFRTKYLASPTHAAKLV